MISYYQVIISNNTNGHLSFMKKTKSASLIKIPSLAASSKKSMQLEINPPLWSRLTATRSIKNLAITKPLQQFYNQLQTDATSSQQIANIQMTASKPATILRNKVNGLHAAIDCLEQQISESKQFGKNKGKDYEQQLKKHEQITKSVKSCEAQLKFNKQKLFQVDNNIEMLKQDFHSSHVNIQQCLAQKQYCDQILSQYKRQHENQSNILLQILQKQSQTIKMRQNVKQMHEQLLKNEKSLNQWKLDLQYDLQQKVVKNKMTQLRIELMKAEEQANMYANNNKMIKIREILCIYLKEIGQANRYWMENLGEEGLEMQLCRNGGLDDFQQAVLRYRGRQKTKYQPKVIKPYFQILHKIQQLLNNPKSQLQKKIHKQYTQQISSLRIKILQSQQKILHTQQQSKQLSQKLQLVFANDSVAIIEHLREKSGRYDIHSIKATLKQLKDQQKIRIQKIRQIYWRFQKLNRREYEIDHVGFMNDYAGLKKEREKVWGVVCNLETNLKNLKCIKEDIENQISMAVSKWGELSCKKQQLKQLYKDLNKLNKEIRQADLLRFKQRQGTSIAKPNQTMLLPSKKSQIVSKCMRQTLKLRINGTMRPNKENQSLQNMAKIQKSDSKTFRNKQTKQTSQSQQNCRTRKCSLVDQPHQVKNKNTGRDSLTAVLFSKFAL